MQRKFTIIAVVGLIGGGAFLFPTRAMLKDYHMTLGLSYNNHILIGTLAFITAVVAMYKLMLTKKHE